MNTVFNSLFQIFALILTGFTVRPSSLVQEAFWVSFDRLNYFVFFPALLFSSLWAARLDRLPVPRILLVVWISLSAVSLTLLALRKLVSSDGPGFASVFQGSIRFNSYVALGTIPALFGSDAAGLASILVAVTVPMVNVACILALSAFASHASVHPLGVVRSILRNPLILACMIGFAPNRVRLNLPVITGTLGALGNASLACGLISVGAELRFEALSSRTRPLHASMVFKFALLPLATVAGCATFGLDGETARVLAFFHTLPTASASYVLARQLGGDHALMSAIITAHTVVAFVAMPFALWLLSR